MGASSRSICPTMADARWARSISSMAASFRCRRRFCRPTAITRRLRPDGSSTRSRSTRSAQPTMRSSCRHRDELRVARRITNPREDIMHRWMFAALAALIGAALAMDALPAYAQSSWKSYVVKELGFSFMAPGKVEVTTGSFRGAVAGPRQTMVFKSTVNNIEYKVTVMTFKQAQAEGASILGERTYMFQDNKKVLMDTFARVEPGKDSVYGRKMVVELPENKGRTFGAFYFHKGKLIALESTVLPANGDFESPDPARFVDSIVFVLSRTGENAIELQAPKLE